MKDFVIVLLLLSGGVITALGVFAFHRKASKLVSFFALSMLFAGIWNFGFAAEIIAPTVEAKLFWANIQFLGITLLPPAWFLMSLAAAGQLRHAFRPMIALSVVPVITNVLIWTDAWHNLFRGVPALVSDDVPFPVLDNDYGPFFFGVHAPYGYLLFVASLLVLFLGLRRRSGVYRRQIRALIISVLLPLMIDLLYVLGISPIPGFNFASIGFAVSGVILTLNIIQNQFLDLLPQAYDAAVQDMPVGVIVLDEKGSVTELNPAAELLTGVVREEAIGKKLHEQLPMLIPDAEEEAALTEVEYLLEGRRLMLELQQADIISGSGMIGSVLTLHDVTERVELMEEVERLSITDPLTGALNRRALADMGRREIQRAYRYHHELSMVLLDVDRFKEFNDTYGHQYGDEVLKTIVACILRTIRSTDRVFRYGGDEFIVLLVETDPSSAVETAERIRGELREVRVGGEEKTRAIEVSVGVTGLESNDTPEHMMQRADRALYSAKDQGGDGIVTL